MVSTSFLAKKKHFFTPGMTEQEELEVARMLGNRYNPNQDEALQKEIESGLSRMLAIRFDIDHLTGKEAIELVRRHQNND